MTIRAGDEVLLWTDEGPRRILRIQTGVNRVAGLGVLRDADFIGKEWGATLQLGDRTYRLLKPTTIDRLAGVERQAQIILPKDASRIVYECGLAEGSRVAEAGVGSGALTLALARAVGTSGRVFAFDIRDDHLAHARKNIGAAGYLDRVGLAVQDVTAAIPLRDLDAVVLDLPEPEKCVRAAREALAPSGVLAVYSPLVVQVERAVQAMRAEGFLDVRALELIERGWTIHDRGSRPDTNMLGHTGFLAFGRRP